MLGEKLDIYDEQGRHIGVKPRSEVHRAGDWHQTFHCWLYRRAGEQIHLLFQKRHPEKDTCPNLLDITSAGHLLAGERPEDGVRELAEELGLHIAYEALAPVGVIRDVMTGPQIVDKEMCHVFLYECDQPLSDYKLQEEEVVGLLWVELDEIVDLFAGKTTSIQASGFLLQEDGAARDCALEVGLSDFVAHEPHYYHQVFTALQRRGGRA
ncbi:NUDIX hydrolase [Brevibacillus panacihumi]|uniref:NUDIX domain-containing protein n=1 Tax=Brevibacillus panacihumi TaxID=497735 RepID=A0A3M8DDA6_9BACL|nr:NUDIX domain-containing protein [Brevibacillus panacihumi]RNB86016.1 NUDIX domain-containing protein [Brevibacillus panacihumi]